MPGVSKHNQKMKGQLEDHKVPSLHDELKTEHPTFSRISILDNEEIFPFLKPLAPSRMRKRARPYYVSRWCSDDGL